MKKIHQLLFIILLVLISVYYGYNKSSFLRPQSIHAWRQADCASITMNYYQNGMNFFRPQVHNLTSDGGNTGYSATSEVPVLYFFSALLYKIFGPHEFIIRIINLLIFFLGLLYLYKLIYFLWKDFFWATALSLLFFTSPVLVYYGNNYLINVSGLSLSIAGLYFFTQYYHKGKSIKLILSLLFFLLAGSFKVTSLMLFFAIAGYFVIEKFIRPVKGCKPLFIENKIFISGFILIIAIISAWLLFADFYNEKHDCYYFSTTIFPIWSLSFSEIADFIQQIWKVWSGEYFHLSVHILFAVMLLYVAFNFKKINRFHLIVLIILLVESILYILLQFWTFHDHDYYTIEQNIVPVFIVITTFDLLFKQNEKLVKSPIIKIAFALFLIFNVFYANSRVEERYRGWHNSYFKEKEDIYTITPYLREIGIKSCDKVIYIPDYTNVSLYLMNQPGWTQYTDKRLNIGKPIKYNQDSTGISESIKKGARYLIINNYSDIYLNPYVKSFTNKMIGSYGSVLIFDLKDTTQNFRVAEPILKDSTLYEVDKRLNINSKSPFGKTISFHDCKYGERFLVSIRRNGSAKGGIVAGGPAETEFYLNETEGMKIDTSGWERVEMDFFVPKRMEGKELKIYLYNPADEGAYFDKFEVKRYVNTFKDQEQIFK